MEAKFAKILAWDAVFGKKTLFGREVTEILVIKITGMLVSLATAPRS